MKKPNSPTEKPTPEAKTEKPVAVVATEAKAKNIGTAKKPSNKQKTIVPKPTPKEKPEQPTADTATPVKPSPTRKSTGKAKVVNPIAEVSIPEMAVPERVGLVAGDIWHYLDKHGATPVAKLVRELPEEEKIIQRSIGWLAQEGKITLDTIDRVETIGLAS